MSPKMMRIVIAGSNGFAQYLAHYLETTTAHQFVILSRKAHPGLSIKGWQVIPTDYSSIPNLIYLLTGVDVVLSTISGDPQLFLIDAAAGANVRTFVPSAYREHLSTQMSSQQNLSPDLHQLSSFTATIDRLQFHAAHTGMNYTVFTCGLFYERFAPGGLAASQIDITKRLGAEGEFLVDIRGCKAKVPTSTPSLTSTSSTTPPPSQALHNQDITPIHISLTSARDTARYIVAALSLPSWPRTLTLRAERISLTTLISICSYVRGLPFQISLRTRDSIIHSLNEANVTHDSSTTRQMEDLLGVLDGRYDVPTTNLDRLVHLECEDFETWLRNVWAPVLSASSSSS